MRRPVRTMTFPPISSRRIRFGEPMSPTPSGVIVAALSPYPSRLEREVEARELEVDPGHVRSKHAQRLVEELLACLVSFENDDNPHVAILLAGSSLENTRSLCTCNSAS